MRIVFMGTPEFAVASLDALSQSKHSVVGVVTVADRRSGRGKKLNISAVKDYALKNNIDILQPEKLKDPEFITQLKKWNADLFIVVAFRMLPEVVWSIPPKGTFNIHGSLLPQYRGAAPINHAIINGDIKSGLTTFMIDEKIDTGKIILQREIAIKDDDDAGVLHDNLMELSREIVIDTCNIIENNELNLIPQKQIIEDANKLRPAPKIFKEHCHITHSFSAEKAQLLVRGLSPYPASFVELVSPQGQIISLKLFKTSIENISSAIGEITTDGKTFLGICFGNTCLKVYDLQLQSKKRMQIGDFLRGFSISKDWKWQ